ncbi:MAG: ribosomal-processing cysteine protease Prp [Spirochaetales bacterium]
MIHINLVRTEDGSLCSCNTQGHSLFAKKGNDIVCAATTFLLRTTVAVLQKNENITVKTDIPARGKLSFCVRKKNIDDETAQCCENQSSLLIYAADFLETGFQSLCDEYPEHVSFKINKPEAYNGT